MKRIYLVVLLLSFYLIPLEALKSLSRSGEDTAHLASQVAALFEKKEIAYVANNLQEQIQNMEKQEPISYEARNARLILDTKKHLALIYNKRNQRSTQEEPLRIGLRDFFEIAQDLYRKNESEKPVQ